MDMDRIDALIAKLTSGPLPIGDRVQISTELFQLTGERLGSDPEGWRAWRAKQRGTAPAQRPTATPAPAHDGDPPVVDAAQLRAAVERLNALGLRVRGTIEHLASELRKPWFDRTRTLESQLLRADALGWMFALEGPEDTVPAANFLVGDEKFLTTLLTKMAALGGGAFAPSRIVDEQRPARDPEYGGIRDHVLVFEFAGRTHTVVMAAETLAEYGCARTLGRVFDVVNHALAAEGAPLRYVCVPDASPFSLHADAFYRVLAVRADALAALRELTPVVYGATDSSAPGGAWASTRIRGIRDIVPRERVGFFDGESIDSAADYVGVARELAALTAGALSLESASCERAGDRGAFRLAFRAVGREYRAELPAHGDFVALPRLLEALNEALAAVGATRSLRAVRDETLGQEFAVAFVDAVETDALRVNGLLATNPQG